MAAFDRDGNRDLQSPDNIQLKYVKKRDSYEPLKGLEGRFDKQVYEYGLDDPELPPEIRSLFVRQNKIKGGKVSDQLHHIHPVRNFDGLFANNTNEGNRWLQQKLRSGDDIRNVLNVAQLSHQGVTGVMDAVHTLMKEQGVEIGGAGKLHPVLAEIELAADMPLEYKLHLADRYNDEVRPIVEEILDGVLQNYEDVTDAVVADARFGETAMANVIKENQLYESMGKRQIAKEKARARLL